MPTMRASFVQQVAGANRRWRLPSRCRGSRHESAVAQLSTLGLETMSKCPYCNRRTNPLRWITVTNWTGYRCGFCGRRSRPPLWQSALAGGLGGAVGAGLGFYAIVNYGWIGFAALFVLVTTAVDRK